MKKINILLISLMVLASSCSIYRYEDQSYREIQPKATGIITPTTADLNVSPTRISYTEIFKHEKDENDINLRDAKEQTLSNALAKYNADMMVGTLFDVSTSESADQVVVTVVGYPATYVNFRPATSEDSLLIAAAAPAAEKSEYNSSSTLFRKKLDVKRGWQNAFNLLYGLSVRPGIEYQGGNRFNKWGLVGFGFGYSYNIGEYDYMYSYVVPDPDGHPDEGYWTRGNVNYNYHYVPVYAHFKVYILGDKRVNPFVGIEQGVGLCIRPVGPLTELSIGSHTRGEIGLNFRINAKTGVALSYNIGVSPTFVPGSVYTYPTPETNPDFPFTGIGHKLYQGFKLGINF